MKICFAVQLRGKLEKPYEHSVVGRLKPEMLLLSALGCDGIFVPALQKKFHNLIPFSKADSAKANDQ